MVSDDKIGTRLAHIKHLKNPIQLRPPTRNLSLVIARSKVFDQRILPGQFVDRPLYFLNTPVIEDTVGGRTRRMYHRIDSRFQLVYRIAYGLAQFVCPLSICSPPKGVTDVGAEYPEIHAILFVRQLVLTMLESGTSRSRRGMRLTLIVVRRIVTTPKTAGAGVMLEASFPMFTRPMATSSERIALSRFFGCLDLSVMVGTQGSREVAVLCKSYEEYSGR